MSQGSGVTKSTVFKEFIINLLASTRSQKKLLKILILDVFDALFVDGRHFLDFAQINETSNSFRCVANGFHDFLSFFFF